MVPGTATSAARFLGEERATGHHRGTGKPHSGDARHTLGGRIIFLVAEPVDSDLRVSPHLLVPAAELSWRFSRSGGPGGQGVNTTDSRVELTVDLTTLSTVTEFQRMRLLQRLHQRAIDGVVTIAASETRSQLRNREAARARLRMLLADALKPDAPQRRPTKPSKRARARRVDAKVQRGQTKRLRSRPHE